MRSVLTTAIVALCLMAGCETEIEPEGRAEAPVKAKETDTSAGVGRRGGGAALGKAKQSAGNTVNRLEQRDAEIQQQLEGDGG